MVDSSRHSLASGATSKTRMRIYQEDRPNFCPIAHFTSKYEVFKKIWGLTTMFWNWPTLTLQFGDNGQFVNTGRHFWLAVGSFFWRILGLLRGTNSSVRPTEYPDNWGSLTAEVPKHKACSSLAPRSRVFKPWSSWKPADYASRKNGSCAVLVALPWILPDFPGGFISEEEAQA